MVATILLVALMGFFVSYLYLIRNVKELKIERNRVVFDCVATNQNGDTVIVGEAEIMPPKKG